jgi:membrane-bound lytic murein transglycosylase A
MRRWLGGLAGALWALAALAQTPAPPEDGGLALVPARYADLPNWAADQHLEVLAAMRQSCARRRWAPDADWSTRYPAIAHALTASSGDWVTACRALAQARRLEQPRAAKRFVETWFAPYVLTGPEGAEGLFTGYYDPELRASPAPDDQHRVPIYAHPGGRMAGLPRAAIDNGALNGHGLEIAWAADPVDVYFLQIQGSGRLRYPDGRVQRIGYSGQNGQPYVALGALLVSAGHITRDEMSMQALRAWLAANPDEGRALMLRNPSYVYFRQQQDGPIGAEGVQLTAGRSLAVDPRYVPLGSLLWLDTADPLNPRCARVQRLLMAQDTGGQIRGAIRGDVFWGGDDAAAERAGRMRSSGRYWLLLPTAADPERPRAVAAEELAEARARRWRRPPRRPAGC